MGDDSQGDAASTYGVHNLPGWNSDPYAPRVVARETNPPKPSFQRAVVPVREEVSPRAWRSRVDSTGSGQEQPAPPDLPRLRHLEPYLESEWKMLGRALGLLFLPVLAFVFLVTANGSFLSWHSDVPLFLLDSEARAQLDAVRAAQAYFSNNKFTPSGGFEQQTVSTGRTGAELALELVYVAKHGDIFQPHILEGIKRIEDAIQSVPNYTHFCLQSVTETTVNTTGQPFMFSNITCLPPESAVRSCVPAQCPECVEFQREASCEDIRSTPPGLLDCTSDDPFGCTPLETLVDPTFKDYKLGEFSALATTNSTPWQAQGAQVWTFVHSFPDSGFGSGSRFARALRSKFRFGLPLAGYSGLLDRPEEQERSVEAFLRASLHPMLVQAQAQEKDFDVYWNGPGMAMAEVDEQLRRDGAFIGLCVLTYFVTLGVTMRSWVLAGLGLAQIAFSFLAAVLLTRGGFALQYVGVHGLLMLQVVLGLGSSLVFVWFDVWNQSAEVSSERAERLSWTWRRACRTTASVAFAVGVSFAVLYQSELPVVRSLGVQVCMYAACHSLFLVVAFPACLVVYDKHLQRSRFCFGAASAVKERVSVHRAVTNQPPEFSSPLRGEDTVRLHPLAHFLSSRFAAFVSDNRFALAAFALGAVAVLAAQGSALQVDLEENCVGMWCYRGFPRLLPQDNNYERFFAQRARHFTREGDEVANLRLTLVLGLDEQAPLSRDEVESTNPAHIGSPRWFDASTEFDLPLAFVCLKSVCDDAAAQDAQDAGTIAPLGRANGTMKLGGSPMFAPLCWASEFCDFLENGLGVVDNCVDISRAQFRSYIARWFEDPAVYSKHASSFFGERDAGAETVVARGTKVSVLLTARRDAPRGLALELYDRWAEWARTLYRHPSCEAFRFQSLQTTDSPGWDQFFLLDTLEKDTYALASYAIMVALGSLLFTSGNFVVALVGGLALACVLLAVSGFIVFMGWGLNTVTAIALAMCPGVAVQHFTVLCQGYTKATSRRTDKRVSEMLKYSGSSILHNTLVMLLAVGPLWGTTTPQYRMQVSLFVMTLIIVNFFCFVLATPLLRVLGPAGNFGNLYYCFAESPEEGDTTWAQLWQSFKHGVRSLRQGWKREKREASDKGGHVSSDEGGDDSDASL